MRSRLICIFLIAISIVGFHQVYSINPPTVISGSQEAGDGVVTYSEATDGDQIQIRAYFQNNVTNSVNGAKIGDTIRLLNGTSPSILNFTSQITSTITATDYANQFLNFTLSTSQLPNGPYELHGQINNATSISSVGPIPGFSFTVNVVVPAVTSSSSFVSPRPPDPTIEYQIAYENLQHDLEPKVPLPIENNLDQIIKPTTIPEPKIITQVFEIQTSKDPEQFAKSVGLDYKNGEIRVALTINTNPDTISNLEKFGKIETSSSNLVQMIVPINKINDLLQMPEVNQLRVPNKATQNSIISQGVELVHADQIRKKGIEGKGIKIAILDLGFDTASSEIDKVADSKSFRHDFDNKLVSMKGFGTEYVHGTAVTEIISDIAPKSELYLYTFSTEAEFLQAMDYAMSKKVNLISMSAGWMNYPTDNTSPMTKKVEEAINKGIPFVVSSGNYAETHWEGKFVDSDSDGWHEFSGNDEGLSFNASPERVADKIPIVAYVMWSGKKLADLNVVLTDPNGKVVASSSNVQKVKGDEFEYIYYVPQTAVTYNLGITSGNTKPDVTVEVFAQNDILEYSTAKGSVSVPTDAKDAISVGAINYANEKLEPFSSQGPTNNGKTVPNMVGPDAVKTEAYGSDPFYGTSAAQPHVAGIVALMLEKNPSLTPPQIVALLQTYADQKILPQTGDSKNSFGSGLVTADFVEKLSKITQKEVPKLEKTTEKTAPIQSQTITKTTGSDLKAALKAQQNVFQQKIEQAKENLKKKLQKEDTEQAKTAREDSKKANEKARQEALAAKQNVLTGKQASLKIAQSKTSDPIPTNQKTSKQLHDEAVKLRKLEQQAKKTIN